MSIVLETISRMGEIKKSETFGEALLRRREAKCWSRNTLGREAARFFGKPITGSYIEQLETAKVTRKDGGTIRPDERKVDALWRAMGANPNEARFLLNYELDMQELEQDLQLLGISLYGFRDLTPQAQELARRQIEALIQALGEYDQTMRKEAGPHLIEETRKDIYERIKGIGMQGIVDILEAQDRLPQSSKIPTAQESLEIEKRRAAKNKKQE